MENIEKLDETLLTEILAKVERPARYIGGEYNQAKMENNPDIRFAFAFPDLYEVGMSHQGMKIIYELLNSLKGINCERVFAPAKDLSNILRERELSLFTLETFSPLKEFDFIGFTLQYEMCLTTMLEMLSLSNIPFYANDRDNSYPILIAGGPCCVNPMPFADFFDIIVIGESEELLPQLMEIYKEHKNKKEFLIEASKFDGVFIPNIKEINQKKVNRLYIKDFDKVFTVKHPLVPFVPPIHDRAVLEIMRGCPRGCRFCQAGIIYRPVRTKKLETLKLETDCLIKNSGFEEISLSSLSTTDYPYVEKITDYIIDNYKSKNVTLSLPSLRMDAFSLNLANKVNTLKKSALTFAPEAGTQRMRNIINKNINEETILSSVKRAFDAGYSKIKLYFMVGLPYETIEDIEGIKDIAQKIVDIYYSMEKKIRPRPFALSVSTSCFVPKPFTAFQWQGQDNMDNMLEKQKYLKSILPKQVKYNYHDPKLSMLEAVFAKGDRVLSKILVKAWEKGCIFDSWHEHFKYQEWLEAFEECNINPNEFAEKSFSYEDSLPWDFIDIGVEKSFLKRENEKSKQAVTTPPCIEKCSACGLQKRKGDCKLYESKNSL